jgi:hypothetical protein
MQKFRNLKDVGILCKGKSLDGLPYIIDRFSHCLILNKWTWEMVEKSGNCLKGKKILHWVNHHLTSLLDKGLYEELNVTEGIFWWTERHMAGETKDVKPAVTLQKKYLKKLHFMPDRFYNDCNRITNSGIMCPLFVADELKPKNVWIAGLDFHCTPYLVGEETNFQKRRIEEGLGKELADKFSAIVAVYPEVQFNVLTYYKELPDLKNLRVIQL